MYNYYLLDSNNVVVESFVMNNLNEDIANTIANDHRQRLNNQDLVLINYNGLNGGVGCIWNGEMLLPPKPFESWIWNENQDTWTAPKDMPPPIDENEPNIFKEFKWNEDSQDWEILRIHTMYAPE